MSLLSIPVLEGASRGWDEQSGPRQAQWILRGRLHQSATYICLMDILHLVRDDV